LVPTDERRKKQWAGQLQNKLDQGKIESLVQQLRAFPAAKIALRCTRLSRKFEDYRASRSKAA
jgi:hypothetical protein